MAASAGKMVGVCEDSSSSDEEELRRCQEAVWETRGHLSKDGNSTEKKSKRVVVSVHEHDGNELQVSDGFRTHVAHKLGRLLDSCITETQTEASSCVESAGCDGDDEGFRLFSTSVPGRTAGDAAAPARRRPAPSSSDSDSEAETRLKEAAVSITDLIPSFTASSTNSPRQKKKKHAEEEESHGVKKKKKKKKKRKETEEEEGSPLRAESNGDLRSSEQEHELLRAKQKKKKKKKREGNTEEASN